MNREHTYSLTVRWTGNLGRGTTGYRDYSRDHAIEAEGKPALPGSSDPVFRGDAARYSPEDLLVASLAACHMLWYLHLCADAGITVTGYVDHASGTMEIAADGGGAFREVVVRPHVKVLAGADLELAARLHDEAHRKCFIARSVRFPVRHEAITSWEA